ncbi:MAG: hypothetical protein OXE98_01315, partial [Hyphomicrobiales bacterium]|nr:hypothetical protein [Hyphomicrobiales bacterium]
MSYKDEVRAGLWFWADANHQGQLDGGRREGRPPVLGKAFESENVLVAPDGSHSAEVRAAIPVRERHRWFCSLFSSQALAQSVFGNIRAYGRLDLLRDVPAECGREAFFRDDGDWNLDLERKLANLNEPRPTTVDVLLRSSGRRVAVECKFTEGEFGTCSRTRLPGHDAQYCNGNYEVQQGRHERCALSEQGILYWRHLPQLFDWSADRDHAPCPFAGIYQLARNALAATVSPAGVFDAKSGHMLFVYDGRNPEFRPDGSGGRQWRTALEACRVDGLLRRISWQGLLGSLSGAEELRWLLDALERKYGLRA